MRFDRIEAGDWKKNTIGELLCHGEESVIVTEDEEAIEHFEILNQKNEYFTDLLLGLEGLSSFNPGRFNVSEVSPVGIVLKRIRRSCN